MLLFFPEYPMYPLHDLVRGASQSGGNMAARCFQEGTA
jgi:hypothetical protein